MNWQIKISKLSSAISLRNTILHQKQMQRKRTGGADGWECLLFFRKACEIKVFPAGQSQHISQSSALPPACSPTCPGLALLPPLTAPTAQPFPCPLSPLGQKGVPGVMVRNGIQCSKCSWNTKEKQWGCFRFPAKFKSLKMEKIGRRPSRKNPHFQWRLSWSESSYTVTCIKLSSRGEQSSGSLAELKKKQFTYLSPSWLLSLPPSYKVLLKACKW